MELREPSGIDFRRVLRRRSFDDHTVREGAARRRQLLTIIRQAGGPRHNNDHRPGSRRLLYRKALCYETRNFKLYIGHKSWQETYSRLLKLPPEVLRWPCDDLLGFERS